MPIRSPILFPIVLLPLFPLSGCESPLRDLSASSPTALRTDLKGLASCLDLPASTRSARWTTQMQGKIGLGPSDFILYASIELDPKELGLLKKQAGGASNRETVLLPAEVAQALFPKEPHPRKEGSRLTSGNLGKMPCRVEHAVLMETGILVVAFSF